MAKESLKNKTIKGTAWSAADTFLSQGVSFVIGIILARLLSPEEYGLIGLCLIVNAVLEGFVDSGFSTAVIRKVDANDNDYNTMFIVNMFISILLYFGVFFTSPLIADFFGRSELIDLIKITGLVIIFNALSLTQNTILVKRVNFKAKTKASIVSALLSGVIGIVLAYSGFGVWALAAQIVCRSIINTLSLWVINRWFPNFSFSKASFKYLWGFGWKMLVSGLLDRLWQEAYQLVVGKFYSPATLGQYTRSKHYAALFSSNLNKVVMQVSYPVLSSIQEDKERMVSAYRKIIKTTMFVTAICMLFLAGISEPMIRVLIGDKWLQAASFLPLICISMSLYPLHAINLNMLKVMGRSDLFLIYEILKKIIAIAPICLGIFVGIYAMLIGSIVAGIMSFFINSWYTGKKLGYTSWKQIKDIAPNYAIGTIVALSIYFLKYLPISPFAILPIQIIIGIFVFVFVAEMTKLQQYNDLKEIVCKGFSKIWKK